jgi:beta-ribofuranosylaminobenzene 5'-phosphate synthase
MDLHGSYSGRVDGSAGLSLQEPVIRIVARRQSGRDIEVTCREGQTHPEIAGDVKKALIKVREHFGLEGVQVGIEEMLLPHSGFGSKTQALLTAAAAYCKLYEQDYAVRDLAHTLGRGGTSGIGVQTFESGGFVVDAGHSFKTKNHTFTPSSASSFASPPPIVGRYDFPDWPILVATPTDRRQFFKSQEIAHWQKNCPVPLADAQGSCHVVLLMLIPAVLEGDVDTFCKGINYIQDFAWKTSLRQAQTPVVGELMAHLRELGVEGVGLSSAGATVYALGRSLMDTGRAAEVVGNVRRFLDQRGGGSCFLTKANNGGAAFR